MRVVVVGGSGGIGRHIIGGLLESGIPADISIIARTRESVDDTITAFSGRIKGYVADVTDAAGIAEAFRSIGNFDALINCAGILGPVSSLESAGQQAWEDTVRINLFGTVNCCRAAIPYLKKAKRGKILNLAGGGAAFPRAYHTAYASSKAAVVRFTETLAADFAHDKIKIDVNSIAPGAYNTGMWKDETFDKAPQEWADPKQLVVLVLFLLSDKSDGITGRLINIKDDYGEMAHSKADPDIFTLRRIDNFRFRRL